MSDYNDDVNQDDAFDYDAAFQKKVAKALATEGTVEELQANPEQTMTLHLDDDEAVVMQGQELDDWMADDDNRRAYFDELQERKRDDLNKSDDQRSDDLKKEDAAREHSMSSVHDEEDADIGDTQPRNAAARHAEEWSPDRAAKADKQEQATSVSAEPYDKSCMADDRLYDIRGNVVTSQQIDDIMRSRAENKAYMDNLRNDGKEKVATQERDETRVQGSQYEYHKSVGAEAKAETVQTPGADQSTSNTEAETEQKQSRGDVLRARAAQIATETDEVTRKREQTQNR